MLRIMVAAGVLFAVVAEAGPARPPIMRTVTLAGETGPSYYSVVEQGYRFIESGVEHAAARAADDALGVSALASDPAEASAGAVLSPVSDHTVETAEN